MMFSLNSISRCPREGKMTAMTAGQFSTLVNSCSCRMKCINFFHRKTSNDEDHWNTLVLNQYASWRSGI